MSVHLRLAEGDTISPPPPASDKAARYEFIATHLRKLFASSRRDREVIARKMAAFVFEYLPDINWSGFYFVKEGKLEIGPYQGKIGCEEIEFGEGVCGTAAQRREAIIVKDVGKFPGHIACDDWSRSELVIPIIDKEGRLEGVFDLDSPEIGRFDEVDKAGCEVLVKIFVEHHDNNVVPIRPGVFYPDSMNIVIARKLIAEDRGLTEPEVDEALDIYQAKKKAQGMEAAAGEITAQPRGPRVKPNPALPMEAPEIYRDRKPREELGGRKENIVQFIERVYAPWKEILTRADLRRLDHTAEKAVNNWITSGKSLPEKLLLTEYELNTEKRAVEARRHAKRAHRIRALAS